jgi:glycerophosphoryl diester phosphodiesterase
MMSGAWIIGHRGASAEAPENTLAAFRRAAELGAAGFETDLRVTSDGEFLLLHDARVNRTTDGRGQVDELPLAALRRLDAGSWFDKKFAGERIPTLDEALGLAGELGLRIYLEVKAPLSGSLPRALAERLRNTGRLDRVVVLAFDGATIAAVREAEPGLETALLTDRARGAVKQAQRAGAKQLAPRHTRATPRLVRQAREAGLGVVVWTVNRRSEMRRMLSIGVDGIMTDYPGRLRETIEERRRGK